MFTQIISFVNKLYKNLYTSYSFVYNYMAEYSPSPIKGDTRRFVVISRRNPRTGKVTVTAEGKRRKEAATKEQAKTKEVKAEVIKPKQATAFTIEKRTVTPSGNDGTTVTKATQYLRFIGRTPIVSDTGGKAPLLFRETTTFGSSTPEKQPEQESELARSAGELEDIFKSGATKLESQLPERKIVKGESGLRTFFREGPRAAPPTLKFVGTLIGESGRHPEIPIVAAAGGVVLGAAGAGIAAIGTKSAVAVKLAGAPLGGAFLGSSVAEIQAAPGSEKFNIAARKVLATAGFYGGAKVGTRAIKPTITSIALKKAFVSGEGARTAELIEPGKGSGLVRRQRGIVQIGKKKFRFQLTGKEATPAKTVAFVKTTGSITVFKGTKVSEFDLMFKGAKSKVNIIKPKGLGVSFFEQKIKIGKKTFIKSGLLTERTKLGRTLSEPKITTNLFKVRVRPVKFRSTLALKGGGVVGQRGKGFVTTRTDLATGAIARTGVGISTSGLRTTKELRGVFKLGKKGAVGFTQRFKPLTIFKTTTGKPAGITGVTEISAKVAAAQIFSAGLKPVSASSALSGLGITSFSTSSKSLTDKIISIDKIISSKPVSKSKLTSNNILKAKTTPILRSFSIPTIATITTPTTTQITTPTTTQITTPTTTQITTPSIIQLTTPTITNITTPTITAPPPPPPPPPPFIPGLPGFKPRPRKKKERKKKKLKRKFRKTPSIEAVILGKKGRFPKILTGLELRPLKL